MVQKCDWKTHKVESALISVGHKNLVDILQWRATRQPRRLAFHFLADETDIAPDAGARWSYEELQRRANAIAAQLSEFAHQPVMLAFPAGLEFVAAFLGCLQAGAIAVPVPVPSRHQGLERWQHIVVDAQPQAIVTTAAHLSKVQLLADGLAIQLTDSVVCMAPQVGAGEATVALSAAATAIALDDIALLQYTSGSTSQPRGVMISHRNLMHNLALIHHRFGHSADSRGVIWLPPHHDMGLIGGVLQPLYGGFPVTLLSPTSFLRQPIRWLQAVSVFGGTTSGGPNFAYERCFQRITPEQCRGLDLSHWDLAFTGAEPVQAKSLERFAAAFADCGFRKASFYPCYGLAEATLFVSGGSKLTQPKSCTVDRAALAQGRVATSQAETALPLVSCGQAAVDQTILMVDPQTHQPCSADQVGEIWLAGPSVALGYWQQGDTTQEIFTAKLADGSGPFLRTGDLGFLQNGELFVTGRLKDLIIIRGQNHYPQDIEQTAAQSHAALQGQTGAAFSVDIAGEERLILVQEVQRTALRSLDPDAVIDAMRAAVSRQHGLQVYSVVLLKPGSLPKTTSGKVQRHACKAQFQAGSLAAIGQWQRTQPSVSQPPGQPPSTGHRTLSWTDQGDYNQFAAWPTNTLSESATPGDRPRTDDLIQWLRQYASESINSRLMDERRCLSPAVVLDFGNQGLLGMQVPTKYEGLGLGHGDMLRVLEQLGAIDPTLALFVGLNNVLGIRPILQSATPDFQAHWLPRLATGRELVAFALTEPGAGSNPNALKSHLGIDADRRWRLYGEKIWSGSAAWAGIINVFVQHPAASGISGFAIAKGTPGLRQGPEALTMGMRSMVQNTVYLEGVPVSAAQLLGQPGQGMAVAQDAMMYGRLAIAAACVGGMKRCAQLMRRYSSRRTVSTGRLLDNPVLLTRLGGLTAQIAALSTLVRWLAQRLDRNEEIVPEAYAACKILAPEFYWQAADDLVQCLGGRGYIETNLAPQILRDARVLRIFEGPTETLAMHLGAQISSRSGLKPFLSQVLAAPELAERLFAAAEDILARHQRGQGDAIAARRSAYVKVGELGAIALLWAVQQASSDADARALAWTQHYFEQTLAQALVPPPHEAVAATAATTAAWIDNYIDTIGDIEQSLAGEDETLDALLRQESAPKSAIVPDSDSRPSQADSQSDGQANSQPDGQPVPALTAKSLERWLMQWLAQQLQLTVAEMDTDKAFADYGVDSVMAVELAQDLEALLELQQPLDVTVAWNFPTIAALAAHLATYADAQTVQNLGETAAELEDLKLAGTEAASGQPAGDSPSAVPTLDDLSEAEMAAALAAELATLSGRDA
ncbi:MAG: AMP-binding protein [Leptolyngbyaceae cyanobacterium]